MTALARAASLTSYMAVAQRVGLNPKSMLRKAGIDPATLANPDLRIPASRVAALLEISAAESNCLTIGIQMAESTPAVFAHGMAELGDDGFDNFGG